MLKIVKCVKLLQVQPQMFLFIIKDKHGIELFQLEKVILTRISSNKKLQAVEVAVECIWPARGIY